MLIGQLTGYSWEPARGKDTGVLTVSSEMFDIVIHGVFKKI